MSDTAPKFSTIIKVVIVTMLVCAALGALSAVMPLPAINVGLFVAFGALGWLFYLNIDGSKGLKIIVAVLSAVLNVGAMWYVWTWFQFDMGTANLLLTGGVEGISGIWNAATTGSVTLSRIGSSTGHTLGDGYLTMSAWASTILVAFPSVIWGVLSSGTSATTG